MMKKISQTGFTLLELMLAAAIITISLSGLLHAFSVCFTLNETSRNLSLALNGCQEMVEQIRNHNFSSIYADYNNTTFQTDQLASADHMGRVEVVNSGGITNSNLIQVRVIICWRQQAGRVMGEDTNLNGVWDTGEDDPLNSPAELVTLMSRKSN